MTEVGILGLDTSHAENFASIVDERDDVTISAVWDGGDVRDEAHADTFCDAYDAKRYDEPRSMIEHVDAAMVLTVDWNTHRELAVPFLEAGVPTMIDKPLAGTEADVRAIDEAASSGDAALFGGSAVPFHPHVSELATTSPETVFCAGYGDPFYYGVHLIDTVGLLIGADWSRVATVSGRGRVARVTFENGSTATLRFDGSEDQGRFGFLTVGDRTGCVAIESTTAELERMYEPYLDAFVAAARGERDDRDRLIDAARLLLAVQSASDADGPVRRNGGMITSAEIESEPFLTNYEPYY